MITTVRRKTVMTDECEISRQADSADCEAQKMPVLGWPVVMEFTQGGEEPPFPGCGGELGGVA